MTTRERRTTIQAPPGLPIVEITREFDAPPELVFRAHVEPDLAMRWLGPSDLHNVAEHWDARTGGSWRYVSRRGEESYRFYGSFHEVRPPGRLVQTFTYEGSPDGVSLDTLTLEPLDGGRTALRIVSVVDSLESRDAMVASGMEHGVVEGYQQLDELLATL